MSASTLIKIDSRDCMGSTSYVLAVPRKQKKITILYFSVSTKMLQRAVQTDYLLSTCNAIFTTVYNLPSSNIFRLLSSLRRANRFS